LRNVSRDDFHGAFATEVYQNMDGKPMINPPKYQTAMAFWVTLNDLPGFHCPNPDYSPNP
jgi:hypothetical protein